MTEQLVKTGQPLRLNLGAGATYIEGFTPIDRHLGSEVYPLPQYETDSVDEIRASHILEHFGHTAVPQVLDEWVRVLRPGGLISIAVPDFDKIAGELKSDPLRFSYLFGGQTDANDYHKTAYTASTLRDSMEVAGLVNIKPWTSNNTDCASLAVSLNLCGVKAVCDDGDKQPTRIDNKIKIAAVMTLPRYGCNAALGIIEHALGKMHIPLTTSQGVYWGQKMQRHFEQCVENGCDWILAIDSDSLMTGAQISRLMDRLGQHPHIDCLVALQCRRGQDHPLMTVGGDTEVETDGAPILCTTAHFGLTLIRTECLKAVEKPWFFDKPDDKGEWGDAKIDADIWFWHQWRSAKWNIYIDPTVRIGHVEETVSIFDEHLEVARMSVEEWRAVP